MDRLAGLTLRSVVVFRALQLGDLLCAVPALRALRGALPGAKITLAGLPWAREFVQRFHRYINGFLEFPGYPGLQEMKPALERVPGFIAATQKERFDLAIQMHGSGSIVNPLLVALGAKTNAGFFREGEYCPDRSRFMEYPEHLPEPKRLSQLVEFLGIQVQSDALELPVSEEERRECSGIARRYGLKAKRYFCIHPGARLTTRRWLPVSFAAVADALSSLGLTAVLTGSTEERELARRVSDAAWVKPVDLTGCTSLGALAVLLENARLLVSNDTGVSHVAAAARVPSVVVVTGSDPARWAPLDRHLHRTAFHPVPCRPCDYVRCPFDQPCASGLKPESVLFEAKQLLASF